MKAKATIILSLLLTLTAFAGHAPEAPVSLEASISAEGCVTLSWWDTSHGEQAFVIERAPVNAAGEFTDWQIVATLDRNTETWTDCDPWDVTAYRVSAWSHAGCSDPSNWAVAWFW